MRGKSMENQDQPGDRTCFNEARALCAGSNQTSQETSNMENASMRPAHYAREVPHVLQPFLGTIVASMRPAHYAREVNAAYRTHCCTNELQ